MVHFSKTQSQTLQAGRLRRQRGSLRSEFHLRSSQELHGAFSRPQESEYGAGNDVTFKRHHLRSYKSGKRDERVRRC